MTCTHDVFNLVDTEIGYLQYGLQGVYNFCCLFDLRYACSWLLHPPYAGVTNFKDCSGAFP